MKSHVKLFSQSKNIYIFDVSFKFNVSFKIISAREMGLSVGGARTWLVSHVPRVGLEPKPDTAVR